MPILSFFFDFRGRVGRLAFALGSTVAGVVASATIFLLGGNPFGSQPTLLLGAVALIVSVPTLALTVKRCHDLGLTGWWAIPPVASVPLAAHATALLTAATWNPGLMAEASLIAGIASIVGLVAMGLMVKLCFFVGQSGDNAFGPERSFAQNLFGDGTATETGEAGPSWGDAALAAATSAQASSAPVLRRGSQPRAMPTARATATPAFGRRR